MSGNPKGRPRRDQDIAELARTHTAAAIETLVGVMRDAEAPPSARITAASVLLDRGWEGSPVDRLAAGDLEPGYEQRAFPEAEKHCKLRLIGSRDGRNGSVKIHQDVELYATLLAPGDEVSHDIAPGRGGWLQVARGSVTLNGETLNEGDGVAIAASGPLHIKGAADAEVLLFDLGR